MTPQQRINNLRAELNALEKELKGEQAEQIEKVEYPICKISKTTKAIALFDDFQSATLLKRGNNGVGKEGEYINELVPYTYKDVWKSYPYDKERGFYHRQMVYCWDNGWTHKVHIGFYDAINKSIFDIDGGLNAVTYDNYSANVPEFMNSAYDTLEK
jgi:hypothetical protein